jgi:hypothetical protein
VAPAVDAIDRHAGRGFAHIGEEVLERAPSLAHLDAIPTVIFERDVAGIAAPIDHSAPEPVELRAGLTMGPPTTPMLLAAARLRIAARQIARGRDNDLAAAIATAQPPGSAGWMRGALKSDEPAETLTSKVEGNSHSRSLIALINAVEEC